MIKATAILIAAATSASGGALVLGPETPVELGVFVGGVIACVVSAWRLGSWVQKLINRLDNGDTRFDNIEHRLETIEQRCLATHSGANLSTQRVEVSE